jgi:5-methylcytosine-specific restriction endonuclease McrA
MELVEHRGYIHLKSFPAEKILRLVGKEERMPYVVGDVLYQVNLRSARLFCLKRSQVCVRCGRVGTVMSLDRFRSNSKIPSAHFNLYSKEEDDMGTKYVLMTKDHIIPRSRGGKNHDSNLQTMCTRCNCKKGATIEGE